MTGEDWKVNKVGKNQRDIVKKIQVELLIIPASSICMLKSQGII